MNNKSSQYFVYCELDLKAIYRSKKGLFNINLLHLKLFVSQKVTYIKHNK